MSTSQRGVKDVDMHNVWSEGEDVIMQDYVPAAVITSDKPTSHNFASSTQATTDTQSESSKKAVLYSKAFNGQPIRPSPHVTHGPNIFRPRHARDQRMRRLIVDRHVRSITRNYKSISPLQDPTRCKRNPILGDFQEPTTSTITSTWEKFSPRQYTAIPWIAQ